LDEENHEELLQLCNGDADRLGRIQWWKDRQELTPSVFNAMADCKEVRHLHLTGVAISDETGHMDFFKSMANLHITDLISIAPEPARGLYLMEPDSIFWTMPDYLDHLELNEVNGLTRKCFDIITRAPEVDRSRWRGHFLSNLILRRCSWVGSPPVLNAGSLSACVSFIDLTGTRMDDVTGLHESGSLARIILSGTHLTSQKRERITAECDQRIEIVL
jgi:hypothetical protein